MDASGNDIAQRRYFPFGGDRAVSGASDLSRDERYTGQSRLDSASNNPRLELSASGGLLGALVPDLSYQFNI